MTRLGVALLALAWAGPAWAGCSNYVDGSTDGPAPRATVCIAGSCEETALEYNCGNASNAQWGYLNGVKVEVEAKGFAVAFRNGHEISMDRIECTAIDEGACFIRPKR